MPPMSGMSTLLCSELSCSREEKFAEKFEIVPSSDKCPSFEVELSEDYLAVVRKTPLEMTVRTGFR